MALKCGIIGVANVGKSTLFNCMSNTKVETSSFAFTSSKSNMGMVNVPDPRLYNLENFQPTEKIIPATVEIVDILVKVGDTVSKGGVVAEVEAMKAKHDIKAPCDGKVSAVHARIGDEIDASKPIMTIA